MKHVMVTAAFILSILLTTSAHALNTEELAFGEPMPDSKVTSLETFFENPNSYIGKQILVEGIVTNSCEKMGCWMTLKTASDHELFRIKVNDGEMVFPISARGRTAWAFGTVETIEIAASNSEGANSEESRTLYQLRPTAVKVASE